VSVHAEVNALMQSHRDLRAGGTVYVTAAPCWKCLLAVCNSGARRLVCPPWEADRRELATACYRMLTNTQVKITHWEDE
jgi:deoxycytidylate deaminase